MKLQIRLSILASVVILAGCGKHEPETRERKPSVENLVKVSLRLDWYAEPAHGGFYQALLKGYYKEKGLDVEILQGGPGVVPLRSVATGQADLALSRVDDVVIGVDKGLPVQLVMGYMQKDPQGIMFHASNPIESWEDLNGKTMMLNPGNAFVSVLRKQKNLEFNVIPLDYGIQRFLADEDFIQQCFVTSQPFFAKQNGADVRVMLLSDESYSPERVVVASKSFAQSNPTIVRRFVEASIQGWEDYMKRDPSETHTHLLGIHTGNTEALNEFSHQAMAEYKVVSGNAAAGESLGLIDSSKLAKTVATLHELDLIEAEIPLEALIDYSILPDEVAVFSN